MHTEKTSGAQDVSQLLELEVNSHLFVPSYKRELLGVNCK